VAQQFFGNDGDVAVLFLGGLDHFPGDFGQVGGDAAQDLAVKVLDDLGAALVPPEFGGGHRLAVF